MSAGIDLHELRSRTPLLPLIERHVSLKREAGKWKGCCPFHGERTPSFTVFPDHYHCFGCGAHGDAISFVRQIEGLSFADAVKRLAGEAGMDGPIDPARAARMAHDRAEREAARAAKETADQAVRLGHLHRRLKRTGPLAGTIAERYLAEARGIPIPVAGWPDVLRFDAHRRALVTIATDAAGEVRAAQWIHLTADANKAPATEARPTKQSFGVLRGAAVRLPGRAGAPLQTAEGPETGLSVWAASGCETWIALGTIGNLPTPAAGREVVACLDDDARHKPAARQARKTLRRWQRAGVRVFAVKPWPVRREDGSDFNDLLRASGTGAVEARILDVLEPGPRKRAPVPVDMTRYRLARLLAAEADAVLAGADVATTAIGVGAGGGKTQMALEEAIRMVRTLRERGDPRTVAIATPRGDLNHKHAARVRDLAPDVITSVYHGADAENPDAPGQTMCRNPNDRRMAEQRGLDPAKAVCPVCPLRAGCAYLAQASRRADTWLVPHPLMFSHKPRALGDLAWLVVDENPISAALIGGGDPHNPVAQDRPPELTIDTLRRADACAGDAVGTDRLHEARGRLIEALTGSPNTRLMRAALIAAGLTADTAEQAIGLEYATKILPTIDDGMPLADRLEVLRTADANADLSRRVMLWRAVLALLRSGHDASSRVELVTLHERQGALRAVRLKGRRAIKTGWQVHTSIIDATLQPALLREIWPDVTVHDLGALAAPHRHIEQVADRAFSLAMLDADDPRIDEKERRRRGANLHRLHVTLALRARRFAPGRVLVVAQKRITARLQALGAVGENVVWAHHGAVTGRDDWGDVRAVIVVGRSMPPPAAVESQAEALTGAPVQRLARGTWYPLVDATREMADGTLLAAEAVRHPDAIAEAFRWRACEGELVQIIERARGVNRRCDAERVDVVVLTDVPLPLPVDALIAADEMTPRIEDRMLAAAGAVLSDGEDAARAYPTLFRSGNAVRVARYRERERHAGDWTPPPGLRCWRYRRAVNGAHHATALIDPSVIADPSAWLTDRLGPLAMIAEAPLPAPIKVSLYGDVMEPSQAWAIDAPAWAIDAPTEIKAPDG